MLGLVLSISCRDDLVQEPNTSPVATDPRVEPEDDDRGLSRPRVLIFSGFSRTRRYRTPPYVRTTPMRPASRGSRHWPLSTPARSRRPDRDWRDGSGSPAASRQDSPAFASPTPPGTANPIAPWDRTRPAEPERQPVSPAVASESHPCSLTRFPGPSDHIGTGHGDHQPVAMTSE